MRTPTLSHACILKACSRTSDTETPWSALMRCLVLLPTADMLSHAQIRSVSMRWQHRGIVWGKSCACSSSAEP